MLSILVEPDPEAATALRRELFAPCSCGTRGAFCPAHGGYEPFVSDQEIVAAVRDNARRPVDGRVVRKKLER